MVTAVITSHRRTKTLKEAIDSVLMQEDCEFELLVINGLLDYKPVDEIMAAYANDERVKYIKDPSCVQQTDKHALGLKMAKGEFIYFLDDDDYLVDRKFFSDAGRILGEHPSYCLVSGSISIARETPHGTVFERRPHNFYGRIGGPRYFKELSHGVRKPIGTVSTLFRKEALSYGKPLDFFVDKSIFLKAALWKNGNCFAYHMSGKSGVYRMGGHQSVSNSNNYAGGCGWKTAALSQKEDLFRQAKGIIKGPLQWWSDEFRLTFDYFDKHLRSDQEKLDLAMWGLCHTHRSVSIRKYCTRKMFESGYSPIRLFYYNGQPNFGDALAPYLVSMMSGRPVKYDDYTDAEMMSVGSIFGDGSRYISGTRTCPDPDDPIIVWGSGFLEPRLPDYVRGFRMPMDVRAVRGKLTRDTLRKYGVIGMSDEPALGDPGLFYSDIIEKYGMREDPYDLAIVPHLLDIEDGMELKDRLSDSGIDCRLIDVKGDPTEVLSQISGARKVLASAMHALIVCDALQIPHRHMRFSKWLGEQRHNYQQSEFKYRDYYSAFDMDPPPFITEKDVLSDPDGIIKSMGRKDMVPAEKVADVKCGLLDTFPFKRDTSLED